MIGIGIRFGKEDILYLFIVIVLALSLLSIQKDTPLSAYPALANAKEAGIALELEYLPPALGVLLCVVLYAALRTKFQPIPTFVAILLMASTDIFLKNFAANSFGTLLQVIFGIYMTNLSFNLDNFAQVLPLLPLSLFSAYILAERRNKFVALPIIVIPLTALSPLLSFIPLTIFALHGLSNITDKKSSNAVLAFLLTTTIICLLIGPTKGSAILGAFVGVFGAALAYLIEERKALNYFLLTVLLSTALTVTVSATQKIEKLDTETMAILGQLPKFDGKIAFASVYGENITSAALYIAGQNVSFREAFEYIFTNGTANFDYIILDTLILDDPIKYSACANLSVSFDTFRYEGLARTETGLVAVYTSLNRTMVIDSDTTGKWVSDIARIDGEEVSVYRLVHLNATDKKYERWIYPRRWKGINAFELIKGRPIWESNSSRIRMYSARE